MIDAILEAAANPGNPMPLPVSEYPQADASFLAWLVEAEKTMREMCPHGVLIEKISTAHFSD